jgi:hypothetical protein
VDDKISSLSLKVVNDNNEDVTIPGAELEKIVDRDLDSFRDFYKQHLGNEFSKFERAAIKSYLWWKTHSVATTQG